MIKFKNIFQIFSTVLLLLSATVQADIKNPLGLHDIEIIINPTDMMKPTMVKDNNVQIDEHGNWHYHVKGRAFTPPFPILTANGSGDKIVDLLKQFLSAVQKGDLTSVQSLYNPETAASVLDILKDPESAKTLLAQYAQIKSYDLTLIVEYGGEGKAVAFSRMETSGASSAGYPPLGLIAKDGAIMLEYMKGSKGFLYNVMLGLTLGRLEVRQIKQ